MIRLVLAFFVWILIADAEANAQTSADKNVVRTSDDLRINQIQFVGSHNSYKKPLSKPVKLLLRLLDPKIVEALDYAHKPLARQLDLGLRKLELDLFYTSQSNLLPVGHVQLIDMNTHCATLTSCLMQIRSWSDDNPEHVPIWISFNAKDQNIRGLPRPELFDLDAFALMDKVLEDVLGQRIIRPAQIQSLQWPKLNQARGKFILILDEGGSKGEDYYLGAQNRPMFINAPEGHPAAQIMIINDPIAKADEIKRLINAGYMVRTRADADTVEARVNDKTRAKAAFGSGAQAISTDYYLPATHFGNDYQVSLANKIRCNPINTFAGCEIIE